MESEITLTEKEFFGVPKIGRRRRKGETSENLFEKIKLRMVMEIYNVSCSGALAMLAQRAEGRTKRPPRDEKADDVVKDFSVRRLRNRFERFNLFDLDEDWDG